MADEVAESGERPAEASAFGRLLLRHRRSAGLSQAELARSSGMSVRALRELERGRVQAAQRRSAVLLADALGLTGGERESFLIVAKDGRRRSKRAPEALALCALPPAVADLVGRERQLAWLRAAAQVGGVVAVVGHPGVGKTALAVSAAHSLASEFPDGVLAVDLRGMDEQPVTARAALERLLRALGVSPGQIPATQDEQSDLLRMLVEGRRVLVLLDNAGDEAQVRPLLVTGRDCLTLVTCRRRLTGLAGARWLWLDALADAAAVGLLAQVAGADRVAAEPRQARELVELCGSLPLALRIVGNRLATRPSWTLAYVAGQLRDERTRLSSLSAGDLQVRSAFEVSYRRLSPAARLVFRRLAAVPGADFGDELAAVATGTPDGEVETCLDELAETSLLQATPMPGRFQFHDLIRIFAAERLVAEEPPDVRERLASEVLDHLLRTATAAARLFFPKVLDAGSSASRDEAAEWLAVEGTNWERAQRVAAGLGRHRAVLELARAMHWYSDSRMPERPWEQIYQLGVDAARALGDRKAEAELLNLSGWAQYIRLDDNEAGLATHTEALAVAREVDNGLEQAWAHGYMGMELVRLGKAAQGLEHARQADSLAREFGFLAMQLSMRNALGVALRAAAQFEEALAVHRAALTEIEDRRDETDSEMLRWMAANVLNDVGRCLAAQGAWRPAAETHREARLMFARDGIGHRDARSALHEGMAWRQAGEYAQARECLQFALAFFTGPLYRSDREHTLAELEQLPAG